MDLDETIAALQALRTKISHGTCKVEVRGPDGTMEPAKYVEAIDLGFNGQSNLTVFIESE